MSKAYSTHRLLQLKFNVLDFDGQWLNAIGKPEVRGSWLIYGGSTNGKTRFAMQLAKQLAKFGKVVFDSLEEGASKSIQQAVQQTNMLEVGNNFNLLDVEPMEELRERLLKDKKIKFVIIDSLQYSGLSYSDYKALKDEFSKKIFVFISHADGKEPAGATAKAIKYDAFVKIWIEGYKAFAQSRYGGGEPYVIWEAGADKYWTE